MPYLNRRGLGGQYDAYIPQLLSIIGNSTGANNAGGLLQAWGSTPPCPSTDLYGDVVAAYNESPYSAGWVLNDEPFPCGYNLPSFVQSQPTSTNVAAPGGGVAPVFNNAVPAAAPAVPVTSPITPAVPVSLQPTTWQALTTPAAPIISSSNLVAAAPSGTAASTNWFTEDTWGSIPNWWWIAGAAAVGAWLLFGGKR